MKAGGYGTVVRRIAATLVVAADFRIEHLRRFRHEDIVDFPKLALLVAIKSVKRACVHFRSVLRAERINQRLREEMGFAVDLQLLPLEKFNNRIGFPGIQIPREDDRVLVLPLRDPLGNQCGTALPRILRLVV